MPLPFLLVLASLAAAVLVPVLLRARPSFAPAVALPPFGLLVAVAAGGPAAPAAIGWIPSLGVALGWHLDGLARLMALLITGIGTGVFLYAAAYLNGHPMLPRFMSVLCLFMAAMLGAVTADDLLLLFCFWEMTSLASFMLIGFEASKDEARKAAAQGLKVTVGGGLAMLAGILLLGAMGGTFRISALLAMAPALTAHDAILPIVALLVTGAFAKSAQWPLHFWLPNAMAAPAPVSAYLHSATMVKLGVYLLARLNPAFQELALWQALLTGGGAMTMLTGALLALRERDLKRKLAWSTVVALGTLITLVGLEESLAATAMVVMLLVHALYKASLFLVIGIIDKKAGSRDAMTLRGLGRAMPITALAAFLGALSMAGLPPFLGYVAKDLIFTVQLGVPGLLPMIALLVNAAIIVVAGVVSFRPFLGTPSPLDREPADPPVAMWLPPLLLGFLGVTLGLAPWLIAETLVEPAAAAILGRPTDVALGVKQGTPLVFYLSLGALGVGAIMFLGWARLQPTLAGISVLDTHGPNALYLRLLQTLSGIAAATTRVLQAGSLRHYMQITAGVIFGGALLALQLGGGATLPGIASLPGPHQAGLVLLVATGAIAACMARAMITKLMAAGIVGFGIGILFLTLGAADLAFTQFTVETLAIVLVVAVLGRLPFRVPDARSETQRTADAWIAAGIGVAGALIVLAMLAVPFDPFIARWMGDAAVPQAQGRNVVNVILVDFRALDTLGEISVLLVAALAATALVRAVRRKG
jgi:multicomponent Na+:H+ antiporter subunit A